VGGRTNSEVGISKCFYTSAKERIFETKINGSLPDDTTDVKGVRTTNSDTLRSFVDGVLGCLWESFHF